MEGKFRILYHILHDEALKYMEQVLKMVLKSIKSCNYSAFIIVSNCLFVSFGSQVEIIAKEYLQSLTEPKKEPESKGTADAKENCVSYWRMTWFNVAFMVILKPYSDVRE